MQNGIRFTPQQIVEVSDCVTREALGEMIRTRRGRFAFEELEDMCGYCDRTLLDAVAKEDDVKDPVDEEIQREIQKEMEQLDEMQFEPQPQTGPGLFSQILRGWAAKKVGYKHFGRCTGNCAACPAHYGYRYGRWYYGRHHTSGCEFGGNSGGGGL